MLNTTIWMYDSISIISQIVVVVVVVVVYIYA